MNAGGWLLWCGIHWVGGFGREGGGGVWCLFITPRKKKAFHTEQIDGLSTALRNNRRPTSFTLQNFPYNVVLVHFYNSFPTWTDGYRSLSILTSRQHGQKLLLPLPVKAVSQIKAIFPRYQKHHKNTTVAVTRQSVAVQREGGIPVGKKILHPYQGPWIAPSRSAKAKCNGAAGLIPYYTCWSLCRLTWGNFWPLIWPNTFLGKIYAAMDSSHRSFNV